MYSSTPIGTCADWLILTKEMVIDFDRLQIEPFEILDGESRNGTSVT